MKVNKITCDCNGCNATIEGPTARSPKGWLCFSGSVSFKEETLLIKTMDLHFCPDCHKAKVAAIRSEDNRNRTVDEEITSVIRSFVEGVVQERLEL